MTRDELAKEIRLIRWEFVKSITPVLGLFTLYIWCLHKLCVFDILVKTPWWFWLVFTGITEISIALSIIWEKLGLTQPNLFPWIKTTNTLR